MASEYCEVTKILAHYAATTRYDDLPPEVVHKAKLLLLDSVGCAIGGYRTATGRIIAETALQEGAGKEAVLLGAARKVNALWASGANAKLANVLDYDDDCEPGHPGSCVVQSALAFAQRLGSTPRDLIRAIVVGYEVSCRIGAAIQPSPERFEVVWGLSPWTTFGATAAVGCLLGLGPALMTMALGVAGCNAPVSSTRKAVMSDKTVTMVKETFLMAGWAGALAAVLAARGYTGPDDVLDGPNGFWVMFGSDRCDFDRMVEGLGSRYEISHVAIKPYPACRWIHAVLDGVCHLKAAHGLNDPSRVRRVIVGVAKDLLQLPFSRKEPRSMEEAQFSIPYCVAAVLSGEPRGPAWYAEHVLHAMRLKPIVDRVVLIRDDWAENGFPVRLAARVEIEDEGGHKLETRVENPKGSPQRPLSEGEVREKFVELVEPMAGLARAERIAERILRLDALSSLDEVTELLVE